MTFCIPGQMVYQLTEGSSAGGDQSHAQIELFYDVKGNIYASFRSAWEAPLLVLAKKCAFIQGMVTSLHQH